MVYQSDVMGNIRAALRVLVEAQNELEEMWSDEEIMLTPRDVAELSMLMREGRKHLRGVDAVVKRFNSVTQKRKVEVYA